jgi:tetratricopeptide (TPR) repeat protein
MPGSAPQKMDEVTPTSPATPDAMSGTGRKSRRRTSIGVVRERLIRQIEPLLTILLALVVVGSLLAVGTVHVAVLLVVASVALLSLSLVCFAEQDWRRRVPAPAWVLVGLSAYSLLQSIPIPFAWLQRLSPAVAQIWIDARHLLGAATHAPASLSADPAASLVEALKWLSYAAVFATAGQLTRRTGAKRGLGIVVLAALLGGIITIIHGLFGIEKWLGLYAPRYARPPWALSPLLNPNNFSGYMNLATYCAVGLAMTGRPPAPRWALGLVAAVLFALSFLTGSRAGVIALLIGVVLVALALREQARRARRAGAPDVPSWLPVVGAAAVGGLLFLLGTNDIIWEQLLDETTTKFRLAQWTAPLIGDFRWFGVGRGAYETVAASYRTLPGLVTFQHAENFIADWLAEWGIPVCAIALASLGWLLRPRRLSFLRHPLPTAALIGVFVLLLQNLLDLGLEIASVGIATAAVLGSVWGGATRDQERRQQPNPPRSDRSVARRKMKKRRRVAYQTPRAAMAAVASLAVSAGLVITVARKGQPDDLYQRGLIHNAFIEVNWTKPTQIESIKRELAQAIERHPADSYFPLIGALIAQRTGKNEMPWLNQALRRDPLNARAELLLADSLAARGARKQALGVLQRCVAHEPILADAVAQRAVRHAQNLDELELAVPNGTAGVVMLNSLAMYESKPAMRAVHEALLQHALQRQSSSPSTHAIIIDDLIRDLDDPKSPCAGSGRAECEAQLRQHAQVIEAQGPRNLQAVILHSRLLVREGKIVEAAQWLSKHCQNFTSDGTCASQFVTVAARAPGPELLEEAGTTYMALACSTPDSCASAATWIGNLFAARGNYQLALTRFERAANESPSADAWLRVADAAMRSGHVNRAQSALVAARRFGSASDSELEHRVEQARRDQLLNQALKR